jgi:hypothetical protein
MKKRKYPINSDCPLSDKEKTQLGIILDSLEYEAYAPLRHLTSGWVEATVTEYDEFEIQVEVKFGVDSQGWNVSDTTTLDRANLYALSV